MNTKQRGKVEVCGITRHLHQMGGKKATTKPPKATKTPKPPKTPKKPKKPNTLNKPKKPRKPNKPKKPRLPKKPKKPHTQPQKPTTKRSTSYYPIPLPFVKSSTSAKHSVQKSSLQTLMSTAISFLSPRKGKTTPAPQT
ncbi:hypothetical protein TELCIR_15566, partial [Teladorsagia circumcincta]